MGVVLKGQGTRPSHCRRVDGQYEHKERNTVQAELGRNDYLVSTGLESYQTRENGRVFILIFEPVGQVQFPTRPRRGIGRPFCIPASGDLRLEIASCPQQSYTRAPILIETVIMRRPRSGSDAPVTSATSSTFDGIPPHSPAEARPHLDWPPAGNMGVQTNGRTPRFGRVWNY